MLLLKLGNIIDYLIIKHWSIWLWSVDRWLLVSRRNWDNIKCIPWMQAAGVLQVYRVARLFSPHSPKTWQMFVQKSTVKFNYISDSTPVEWSICLETGVIIPGSIFVSSHMQRRSPTFFLHHGLVRTRTWFSPNGQSSNSELSKDEMIDCCLGPLHAWLLSSVHRVSLWKLLSHCHTFHITWVLLGEMIEQNCCTRCFWRLTLHNSFIYTASF